MRFQLGKKRGVKGAGLHLDPRERRLHFARLKSPIDTGDPVAWRHVPADQLHGIAAGRHKQA